MSRKYLSALIAVLALAALGVSASSASARKLFRTEKAGGAKSFVLPDAAGVSTVPGGWVTGFGYPVELVNSGNLKLEATGFKNECTEGEVDIYLNHNSEALNVVEAAIVAGQFECENPTVLATPSGANAVFAAATAEATISNLRFLVTIGKELKCEFKTEPAGVIGAWENKLGGEEGLGSTLKLTKVKLKGVTLEAPAGSECPKVGELTGTFAAETFTQEDPAEEPFDTEEVVYE
jgi:hypothetical protein